MGVLQTLGIKDEIKKEYSGNGEVIYFINEKERTVSCEITGCKFEAIFRADKYINFFGFLYINNKVSISDFIPEYLIEDTFTGEAHCREEDEFNVEIGKKIALSRAKRKRGLAIKAVLNKIVDDMQKSIKNLENYAFHKIPTIDIIDEVYGKKEDSK